MKREAIIFGLNVFLLLHVSSGFSQNNPKTPEEQRVWEKRCDKKNIRHIREMITDTSQKFLVVPDVYKGSYNFEVAQTPPAIDFAIVQDLEPEYPPYHEDSARSGRWGGWGDVTKGPDGCFYFSISNHMCYGGESYVIKYDPNKKTHNQVVSGIELAGWKPEEFADGKFHGDLDIGRDGEMWILSYYGPAPTQEEWDTVYRGSWLFRYNVFSDEGECLGIPLEGDSWPYHNYDYDRNILFGAGERGKVIIFNTAERRMIFGGYPPDGIRWYTRMVMLEHDTGNFYTTASSPEKSGEYQFVRYTSRNNTFTRMNALVPKNPVTGKSTMCRAHTSYKDADGAFWCFDNQGTIFKFYPNEDRTEYVDINWGESGFYTANMCFSPGRRYIYYVPGQFESPPGEPVIQYDTKTNTKKVLAFLFDYYYEKYGYTPVRCYGIELDEKGESLVFYANGGFTEPGDPKSVSIKVRRPAVFQLHIPESERIE